MSTTIDEKVVEMRFDNRDFESNVKTSLSTIEKLKNSLNLLGSSKALSEIDTASKKVNFSVLSNSIDTVKAKFSAFDVIAMRALSNLTDSAMRAGKKFVSSLSIDQVSSGWDKYGQKVEGVQTIMAATGKNITEVNRVLEKLNWYTDETSYNFTDMVSSIGKFTSAGIDLDDSVSAMEGIANWAASAGVSATKASGAFYNISQAIGTGSMKLQDWKSIENLNMNTQKFKQACIDAAVELGTLKKVSNDLYKTSSNSKDVSVANFNEQLSTGWLSSDVLMSVLKRYGEYTDAVYEISDSYDTCSEAMKHVSEQGMELSAESFKMAQEAKTLDDAIGSVKDAVSSGWMTTFEIIFGNYEEAKSLWTDLANAMYDLFATPINDRNEILSGAMKSGYSKLTDEIVRCGGSMETFEEELTNVAKKHMSTMDLMQYGLLDGTADIEKLCKSGVITSDMLREAINRMSKSVVSDLDNIKSDLKYGIGFDGASDEVKAVQEALEAAGYEMTKYGVDGKYGHEVEEAVKLFQKAHKLNETGIVDEATLKALSEANGEMADLAKNCEDFFDEILGYGGRDQLLQGFWNIFNNLVAVIDTVKGAFSTVFPPKTEEDILRMVSGFKNFTESLMLSSKQLNQLKVFFTGVFSIGKVVLDTLSSIGGVLKDFVTNILKDMNLDLFENARNLGKVLIGFSDWVEESKILTVVSGRLSTVLNKGYGAIKRWVGQLISLPAVKGAVSKFKTFFKSAFGSVSDHLLETGTRLYAFIDRLFSMDELTFDNVKGALKDFYEHVVKYFLNYHGILDKVSHATAPALNMIKGAFKDVAESKWFTSLKTSLSDTWTKLKEWANRTSQLDLSWENIKASLIDFKDNVLGFLLNDTSLGQKIQAALQPIKDVFGSYFESIGNSETFQKLKGYLTSVWESIVEWFNRTSELEFNWDNVKASLKDFRDTVIPVIFNEETVGEVLGALSNALASITIPDIFGAIKGFFSNFGNAFVEGLTNIGLPFVKIKETIVNAISQIVNGLVSTVQHINWKAIIPIAFGGFLLKIMSDMTKVLTDISGTLKILAEPIKNITGAFKSMGNAFLEIGKGVKILAFAGSILLLAIALEKLASIPSDRLWPAVGALTVLAAIMGIMLFVVSKASKLLSDSGPAMKAILSLAIMLGVLAGALYIMSKIELDGLDTKIGVLGLICVGMGIIAWALSKFAKDMPGGSTMFTLIGFAGAVFILVLALQKIDSMELNSVLRSLAILGAIMFALGIALKICSTNVWKHPLSPVGILALAGSLFIIMLALDAIADFDVNRILNNVQSLILVLGVLVVLAITSRLCGKNALVGGLGILAMSGSLIALVKVIEYIGTIDRSAVNKAIQVIIPIMAMLSLILLCTRIGGKGGLGAAAVFLSLSATLAIIVGLVSLLMTLSEEKEQFDAAVTAIQGLMKCLALIMASTKLMKVGASAVVSFVVIGLIIGELGFILYKLGELDPTNVSTAASAMTQMAKVFRMLSYSTRLARSFDKGLIPQLLVMAAVIGILGIVVYGLGQTNAVQALGSVIALRILMRGFVKMMGEISKIKEISVSSMAAVIAMVAVIGILAYAISQIQSKMSPQDVMQTVAILVGISAFMAALGIMSEGVAALGKNSFGQNLEGIGSAILMVAAILAAIAALGWVTENIEGVSKNIMKGLDFLVQIAEKIGEVIGKLISGALNGLTDFDGLGETMNNFMTAVGDFSKAAGDVDTDALASVRAILELFAGIVAINFADSIVSGLFGGKDISSFCDELAKFGTSLASFNESVSGATFDSEKVTAAIAAAKEIAAVANSIPSTDGTLQKFLGTKDIGEFGDKLEPFANGLIYFCTNVGDTITADQITMVTSAVDAASQIASVANAIPAMDGTLQEFLGTQDIGKFGDQLEPFASGLITFCTTVGDTITSDQISMATSAIGAAKEIATVANNIPAMDGSLQNFLGTRDLGQFGSTLEPFASGIAGFATNVSNLTQDDVNKVSLAMGAVKTILDNSKGIQNSGGFIAEIFGDNDLGTFGGTLSKFASSLKEATDNMEGVNMFRLSAMIGVITQLCTGSIDPEGEILGVYNFGDTLKDFGKAVNDMYGNIENVDTEKLTNLGTALNALATNAVGEGDITSISSALGNLSETGIDSFMTALSTYGPEQMTSSVELFSGSFTAALATQQETLNSAFKDLITTMFSSISAEDATSGDSSVAEVGKKFVEAYAKSITDNAATAQTTVTEALMKVNIGEELFNVDAITTAIGDSLSTAMSTVSISEEATTALGTTTANAVASGMSGADSTAITDAAKALSEKFTTELSTALSTPDQSIITSATTSCMSAFSAAISNSQSELNTAFINVVRGMFEAGSQAQSSAMSAGNQAVNSFMNGMQSSATPKVDTSSVTSAMSDMTSAVNAASANMSSAGASIGTNLTDGLRSGLAGLSSMFSSTIANSVNNLRNSNAAFKSAGAYMVTGLINGLNSKLAEVRAISARIANEAAAAIRKASQIKSPSRVWMEIGGYMGAGLVKGLNASTASVERSSAELGHTANDSLTNALGQVYDKLSGGIDDALTLRPVLDLTDVESGADRINSMLDLSRSLSMSAGARAAINSTLGLQNGSNDDVVNAINGLRKSLDGVGNTSYNINGVTYDDGSNVTSAVETLVRAARIERRV